MFYKKHWNSLFKYKGGGYDGCFWEWNYFIIDKTGKWHQIGASGRRGLETSKQAEEFLKDKESEFYQYKLTKADMTEFQKETIADHVGAVAGKVNDALIAAGLEPIAFYTCTYCGSKEYPSYKKHVESYPQWFFDENNYRGDGGIGIVYEHIICESCACNTCENCNSVFSPDDEVFEHDERRICEYCHEELNKKQVNK